MDQLLHDSLPKIMGILNVTPDSFSDGGRFATVSAAIDQAARMIGEGADILDIGGESTRPGAIPVSVNEELDRVIPVIEQLRARFAVPLSVDTSQPAIIQQAVRAGASIWNDVRALTLPDAAPVAAALNIPVILMHHRGTPQTMTGLCSYTDVVTEVLEETEAFVAAAIAQGVRRENIWVDPGFGFAKSTEQNLRLLGTLNRWQALGYPLVVGVSRKRMFADICQASQPQDRVSASTAAAMLAASQGAAIIRTHDVRPLSDSLKVWRAVKQAAGV